MGIFVGLYCLMCISVCACFARREECLLAVDKAAEWWLECPNLILSSVRRDHYVRTQPLSLVLKFLFVCLFPPGLANLILVLSSLLSLYACIQQQQTFKVTHT